MEEIKLRLDAHQEWLENIDKKFDRVREEQNHRIEEIGADVKSILSYLRNDETTGKLGMYQELKQLDNRVAKIEMAMKITVAKKAVYVMIGGAIITIAGLLYKIWEFWQGLANPQIHH